MYNVISIALNGTDADRDALALATRIGTGDGGGRARLVLITVDESPTDGEALLAAAAAALGDGWVVEAHTVAGADVARAIIDASLGADAELIVVGRGRHGGPDGITVGLLTESPIPVAVAPPVARESVALAPAPEDGRRRVVIVGGGVAALEAALALRELAGDRVHVTLIAPNEEFVDRPMSVREPFAAANARRYSVADIADRAGATLIADTVTAVDTARKDVTAERAGRVAYDTLLLATGTGRRTAIEHALTVNERNLDDLLHGLVQDVEGEVVRSVAFVVPPGPSWPFPAYELALMFAHRANDMYVALRTVVVGPDAAPIGRFGPEVGAEAADLLRDAGIAYESYTSIASPEHGVLTLEPGRRTLQVDRVVGLPELVGPQIAGVPAAADGFIPTTSDGQVVGAIDVYAAGDATDGPLKFGGLAARQAAIAAETIAATAGAEVVDSARQDVVHGILLTGTEPRYLLMRPTGDDPAALSGRLTRTRPDAALKTDARRLAACLRALDPKLVRAR